MVVSCVSFSMFGVSARTLFAMLWHVHIYRLCTDDLKHYYDNTIICLQNMEQNQQTIRIVLPSPKIAVHGENLWAVER